MVSPGSVGCCKASVGPALPDTEGGWGRLGVRLTCSGLNWKTTMFGSAPSRPAPKLRNAPFNAAMDSFLSYRELHCQVADPAVRDGLGRLFVAHTIQVEFGWLSGGFLRWHRQFFGKARREDGGGTLGD